MRTFLERFVIFFGALLVMLCLTTSQEIKSVIFSSFMSAFMAATLFWLTDPLINRMNNYFERKKKESGSKF
ncbi:MAG: hypothetical protein ACXAC2_17440 [Candidatus Kariarchaeaceae archaeon]|jgi:anaerobic C4-dicarboxylate transporter